MNASAKPKNHPIVVRFVNTIPLIVSVTDSKVCPGPRIGVDHICFAAIQRLHTNPTEVEGVGNLLHKFAALFSFPISLRYSLRAFIVTFILQFVDDLLDAFIFFSRILLSKWLVILANQLPHELAVQNHVLVTLDLG